MVPGDRVELRKDIARSFTRNSQGQKVDWTKRVGSLVSLGSKNIATVKWDDRKSLDYWPIKALVVKSNARR